MEFFAIDKVVAQIEADLPLARGNPRIELMAALSWHLRQRDTGRALRLADEIQGLLANAALPDHQRQNIMLRLMLIRAEEKWLFGDLPASKTLAQGALQGYMALNEGQGCVDAHWLLICIAIDQGDRMQKKIGFAEMLAPAINTDPVRLAIGRAAQARHLVLHDVAATKTQWNAHFTKLMNPQAEPNLHPAAACWMEDFWGMAAMLGSDFVAAIRHFNQAYTLALVSGQQRRAILAAVNIGNNFNKLNEYHAALEWMQRALDLARQCQWPGMIGNALKETAETLRHLKHYDIAHEMLEEALELMATLADSRNYAIALHYMGEIELDRQQYASALNNFELMEQRATALGQVNLIPRALRGQAQALFRLGKPQQALKVLHTIQALLQGSKMHISEQISALRVMADIHAHYSLPRPPGMIAASMPLHYLHQALDLAGKIANYIIPGDLLDALAQEYAKAGLWQKAWEHARLANIARDKTHGSETANRANAMQASHQAERAEAQNAHLRQLAAEAKRAEILQQTSETLEHLSAIGQEITAHLEAELAFEALKRHVHHLLDIDNMGIYLMTPDGSKLDLAFGFENHHPIESRHITMSDPHSDLARCARERREVLVNRYATPTGAHDISAPAETPCCLSAPLCLADQVLGVIAIQSRQPDAYGSREQLIFSTLCAYTAIALSNAEAHGKLAAAHRLQKETQQQMVLQEKMAGLGALTAGVAHEINNPTNFVHVAAQNLQLDLQAFQTYLNDLVDADEAPEILDIFTQRFSTLQGHVTTMLNGTDRIKNIVRDLRAFTRLDEAEKRSVRLSECLASTLNLVRTNWLEKVEFITEFAADPEIECWPALLNQVFMNLLVNGCQAIDEKQRQQQHNLQQERGNIWMRLNLNQTRDRVSIAFEDSGIGIDNARQMRIMEPFYTTKAVGVGTGLGLSIAFGIVQKHGGSLNFTSTPGTGSCFMIHLPLTTRTGAIPV